ncbi:MAG: SgcJ/EcaC family oxidoreductase [Bryobacteraceae bacterium]|jgi:uncharacterized protein (TIGR02246 family)
MQFRTIASIAVLVLPLYSVLIPPARASDESDVRAVVARETEGWAKYDAKEVASVFASDAVWQNPFGVRLQGSAQLEKFLTKLFQRPGYRTAKDTSAPKILDLRFPSPNVAVVWSDESSKGQVDDATGKPMLPRHSTYLEVLVKKDGAWKISDSIIMDELVPSHQ